MQVFDLRKEQAWDPKKHVEKILGEDRRKADVTVACWEAGPDQPLSLPSGCDRDLFLLRGRRHHAHAAGDHRHRAGLVRGASAGRNCMNMPNAPQRTLLFRVRYGADHGEPSYGVARAMANGSSRSRTPPISRRTRRG